MKISLFDRDKTEKNSGIADEVVKTSLEELGKYICEQSWSPSVFKENELGKMNRNQNNFEFSEVVAIDIDSVHTIDEAIEILDERGLGYVIGTTRNHQKEKNGEAACDRFRIVMMLEEPVHSSAQYKAVLESCKSLFPDLDPSCIDSARFFFPCIEIVRVQNGTAYPVSKNDTSPYRPSNNKILRTQERGDLKKETIRFLSNGAENGAWNTALHNATRDLKINGFSQEEAEIRLSEATKHFKGFLDDEDLSVINYIYEREKTRIKKLDPRIDHETSVSACVDIYFDHYGIAYDDKKRVWRTSDGANSFDTRELAMEICLWANKRYPKRMLQIQFVEGQILAFEREVRKEATAQLKREISFCKSADPSQMHHFVDLLCGNEERKHLHAVVLNHFIWQVKRKVSGLSVDHHMMPIFVGAQGIGKTRAIDALVKPLEGHICRPSSLPDLVCSKSFKMRTEHFVAVVDEMSRANLTDMNAFKRVLSGDNESNRVLGGNAYANTEINITCIGASNVGIPEILNDPTGARRLWEIRMRNKSELSQPELEQIWAELNALDYLGIWQAVDENSPSPLLSVLPEIQKVQNEELRRLDSVELFLQSEGVEVLSATSNQSDWTSIKSIYDAYKKFCENSGEFVLTKQMLGRRLAFMDIPRNNSKNNRRFGVRLNKFPF